MYSDYQKILKDRKIDAVVICSPTDTHAQYIQEAAAKGKHIFCEKPVDLSLSNINATISAVEKAGVKLMIGFNRRFDPNFQKVHEMGRVAPSASHTSSGSRAAIRSLHPRHT